jgi:hypothetical protein
MKTRFIPILSGALILALAAVNPALAKPGNTGKSGVTFGGGKPGPVGTPGPAKPTRPTQPNK